MTTLNLDLPHFEKFPEADQKVLSELLEVEYLKILFGLQVEGRRRRVLSSLGHEERLLPIDDLEEVIRQNLRLVDRGVSIL